MLLDSVWPLNLKALQNELSFLSSSTEATRGRGLDIGIKCDLGPDTEPNTPVTERKEAAEEALGDQKDVFPRQ